MLFLVFGFSASAQIEIGLMASPTIAGNRFIAEDRYNLEKESNNLYLGVGVIADYFFSQNYAFSTGVIYRGKGGEVSYNYTRADGSGSTVTTRGKDDIALQYIEVPLTLKLFTNEIAPGTLAYFQVGGSLNTKVAAQVNDKKVINGERVLKRFNIFEADVLLGGGVEFQIGESTKLFGGLTYHRGLTDIDDYYEEQFSDKNVSLKNNSVSLDFGVKF
ncbi:outer membrane protein with beta-barrel domain [Pontibacter ummariensis]|uniref:Outer membrane protein beta-barrel domain-containing protein n=2 Tax=Pontibacter ummariensis TaxID=1610492 RepID=A0A239JJC5_9BACT|nr:outer membrane protein with beta-barrel domain [Pontibacter ummariensis]SNT06116.1 Outer membrane protein beta-barrel domain-containing protein [Pontibacter ummariensis]